MDKPAYIVVTRPAHQAEALAKGIEAAGGEVLRLPVTEITAAEPEQLDPAITGQLAQYDIIFFISANAVNIGCDLLPALCQLPARVKMASVGKATARALEARCGRKADIVPEQTYNTEALLALPALQKVAGQRILIVRGNGGRELLADSLRQRGASVDYLEVYRRSRASSDTRPLQQYLQKKQIAAIVITSAENLQNLLDMLPEATQVDLKQVPLLLINPRLVSIAQQAGFCGSLWVAAAASDSAIIDALKQNVIKHS